MASESQALQHCGPTVFSCEFDGFVTPQSGFYGVVFVMLNHTSNPVVTITGP